MKDIVISGKRIKTEIFYWIASLIITIGINIYAIAKFDTNWSELFSQWFTVIKLSFIVYLLILVLRLIVFGIISLVSLAKKEK